MNPKLRLAEKFIASSVHRDLSAGDIAEASGLKHSRLCELFQAQFGMSPLKYHKTLRLELAGERLKNSTDKVEGIILELGYNRRRFFRDFKAHFGRSPSHYRVRYLKASACAKDPENK
jgi:transcriptional regulator GlxA family with amidase domain